MSVLNLVAFVWKTSITIIMFDGSLLRLMYSSFMVTKFTKAFGVQQMEKTDENNLKEMMHCGSSDEYHHRPLCQETIACPHTGSTQWTMM